MFKKNSISLILIFFCTTASILNLHALNPKIPDEALAFRALGFKKYAFWPYNPVCKIGSEDLRYKVDQIEGDADFSDTLSKIEFIIATYYVKLKFKNEKYKAVYYKEFPHGVEGVYRRCILLYKKKLENPENRENYQLGINMLLNDSGASATAARDYYEKAIIKAVDNLKITLLPDPEKKMIKTNLKKFYIQGDSEYLVKIRDLLDIYDISNPQDWKAKEVISIIYQIGSYDFSLKFYRREI